MSGDVVMVEALKLVYGAGAEVALMSFIGTMVQLSMWPPVSVGGAMRTVFTGIVIALVISRVGVEYAVAHGFNVPTYLAAFVIGWLGERIVHAALRKIGREK